MKKFLKWFGVLFLILLAVAIGGFIYLKSEIKEELKNYLNLSESRKYNVDFEDVQFSLLDASLSFDEIRITPRDNGDSLKARTSLKVYIDKITINGLRAMEFVRDKHLTIDSIDISSPEIVIWKNNNIPKKEKSKTFYQNVFSGTFAELKLKNIQLSNGKIRIKIIEKQDTIDRGSIGDINLLSRNIVLDTASIQYIIPFEYESFQLDLNQIESKHLIDKHNFHLGSLKLNADSAYFELDSLAITPKGYQMSKYWHETFNFKVKNIRLNDIDFALFKTDQVLHSKQLLLEGLDLNINAFLHLPVDSASLKKKPLPYDWIHGSKEIPFTFDEVLIKKGYIGYHIQQEDKNKPALFDLSNVYVQSSTLSNVDSLIGKAYRLNISTKMLKKVPVSIKYTYNWGSISKSFHISGKVHPFAPEIFNPFLQKMANAEFRSGYIDGVTFDFNSNKTAATGKVIMPYKDLKIDLYRSTKNDVHRHDDLLTRVANTVLKTNNIEGKKSYLIGNIETKRNPYKSVFNYNYKCIQEGIFSIFLKKHNKKNERR